MRKSPLLVLGLCLVLFCHSQSGLYLTGASLFSIGANTTVAIDGLVLEPSTLYTLTGTNSLKRNNTPAHPSITTSINRFFQWNTTPTAFTGNIGFYYDDTELNGLAESDLTMHIHDGTQWLAYKSGGIQNTATNLIITPVSNILMNEISLAAEVHPLPLKWGYVSATRIEEKALIKWETYNEDQVNFFTIERSVDGWHWTTIGNAITAANITGRSQYAFYDNSIPSAKVFYRIKQVDQNLQHSYSSVVQVAAVLHHYDMSIYPNPTSNQITIHSKGKLIKTIDVFNANGQLLSTVNISSATKHSVKLKTLSNGVYTLKVTFTDNTISSISFIKY